MRRRPRRRPARRARRPFRRWSRWSSTSKTAATVSCALTLDDVADAQAAVQRTRRLLDLDCDPASIRDHLAVDPLLAPLIEKRPGLRAPGHPDSTELLVRAVLGQQVSVAGARTLAQDEASCVVYGMPKEAVKAGGVDKSLSLEAVAGQIERWMAEVRAVA